MNRPGADAESGRRHFIRPLDVRRAGGRELTARSGAVERD